MGHVRPCDRAETTECFVNNNDEDENEDTDPVGDQVSRDSRDDVPHRHQLREQVIRDRHDQQQVREKRKGLRAETVVHPVAGSNEATRSSETLESRSIEQIDDDDRHHEAHAHDPGVAQPRRLGRIADDGVATVLGRVEGEEQDERTQASPGEIELAQRLAVSFRYSEAGENAETDHQAEIDADDDNRAEAERQRGHSSSPQ